MQNHFPIDFEQISVPSGPIPTAIEDAIKNCQIYLVFLGHRYGSRIPGKAISYTEREYELAVENGLVVVPFVLDEEEIRAKRLEREKSLLMRLKVKSLSLAARHAKVRADPSLRAEVEDLRHTDDLFRFHDRVKKAESESPVLHTTFASGDSELFSARILGQLVHAEREAVTRSLPGWVKAAADPALADAMLALANNPFLVPVCLRLSRFEKLDKRCSDGEKKKRALARFFARAYLPFLVKAKTHLFFESGSTVAFVAEESGCALKAGVTVRNGQPDSAISTNNVLAYLHLWLIHHVPCSPFPWGPPEAHYGAAFGCLDHYYKERDEVDLEGKKREQPDPEFPPTPLDGYAGTAIEDLAKQKFSPKDWTGNVLFLGATSGLQLSDELLTQTGERLPAVGCAGPHVGSFKNKLFKRFMSDTLHPIMLFFTDDKIDSPINTDDCHFVFDAVKPWEDVIRKQPLSFCVGCATDDQHALVQRFTDLGLITLRDTQSSGYTSVIARNQVFVDEFERRIDFTPPRRYIVTNPRTPALFRAALPGACTQNGPMQQSSTIP